MSGELSVLFVPCCTSRVAATRYRVCQYVPYLEARGIRCGVFPAVSDSATKLMLASPRLGRARKLLYYAQITAERLLRFLPILWLARTHQVVFLQRTTFPFGLSTLLRLINSRIIFDFDDSIYMSDPDDGEAGWLRRLKDRMKASEVSSILKASRAAVVENEHLRAFALKYCRRVVVIPGPIDTDHAPCRSGESSGPVVIGWVGSPSTAGYLPLLADVLKRLARQRDIRVRLVGSGGFEFDGVRTENVPWTLETELAELQGFDVGIMPMPDNDWTRGKLGLKMLLYMSVGVPAVVSYTLTNAEVIVDGGNGFLARSPQEWFDKLSALVDDAGLRRRLGLAGRKTVEDGFSVRSGLPKLIELLKAA